MSNTVLILLGGLAAALATTIILMVVYVGAYEDGANAACSHCLGRPATYTDRGCCATTTGGPK